MHILSRETINIAMQIRQRMRNERGDAPKLTDADMIELLLAYADASVDEHVRRLAGRLRDLLPAHEDDTEPTPAETATPATASPGTGKRVYRGRPVD